MSNDSLYLSLCIPTNGVIEWMRPVMESIFSQGEDESLYEVIVTDNGSNEAFRNMMNDYVKQHNNLKYIKSDSELFLNEIAAYKNASGKLIKFINHRTKLRSGALKYFIEFARKNLDKKPCVYFSNGALKIKGISQYGSFDLYVKNLSYLSSWSTGMAFWREEFLACQDRESYNELFPHTDILFSDRKNECYLIDNTVLLNEIPVGKKPKGHYNLFYAFSVDYPAIILQLCRDGDITLDTFYSVKKRNGKFLKQLYYDFVFLRKKCSYDLSGRKDSLNVFYSHRAICFSAPFYLVKDMMLIPLRFMKRLLFPKHKNT